MLTFAIIGAGWIGGIHGDRLRRCDGARLGYVFDLSVERARQFADQHGCEVAASVEDACEKADAVIIASSTVSHADVAFACIAAGKPFLVEKPVAHDVASAVRVRDAVENAGIQATAGFNRRFDARYAAIRQAVANGVVGKLESLRFTVKTANAPSAEFLKTSGGLFGEFGIHFFDLARWISGDEPVEVFATGSTLIDSAYADIGHIDTAAVVVRMRSGVLFQLDIGWRYAYGHDERLEVFGSKGVLAAGAPIMPLQLDAGDPPSPSGETKLPDWFERFEATYLAELSSFVEALASDHTPAPTLHDGVIAQMLADAARESVRTNAPVRIDTAHPASGQSNAPEAGQ